MKDISFNTIRGVQYFWQTLIWNNNFGRKSSFCLNWFSNSFFSYATLLLFGLGFSTNSYSQLVGGSAVKANFGTDGDTYANVLQFGSLPFQSGTDDWFQIAYPGPGFGVIDQHMPLDPAEAVPNTAFSRRQSFTAPTFPFPFPVVHSGFGTYEGDYLWLDAVYGRDNYVKGGNAEKSYFAGSGDKNSDNPSTWNIGTAGSVPQKDDIVDVYAHLRGAGPRIPFTPEGNTDPRPFTTLWAYAGASIVVTNGNKHIDFEFFRTALETPADLSIPGKTGPDGGRTAFTFNANGSVDVPGTIIISVDYINGGTKPDVRIRVWMDEAVFNGLNALPNRPFNVVAGTFEKGELSGNFGYARIAATNPAEVGNENIFGRVNNNASTLGPPWGTFEGVGPSLVTDYQALQFVEVAINLTAFGLDKRGAQSPCSNILGSLLVKTRSSGGGPNEGAFGSELKDFAGPYLFGNTGKQPVVSVPDKTACVGTVINLTEGATTDSGAIEYFTSLSNEVYSGPISNPSSYQTPAGMTTIYVRSESLLNKGCYGTNQFTVYGNAVTPGVIAGDQTLCSPFDPVAFTSQTNGSPASGGVISYQWQMSTTGCEGEFTNISGATSSTYDAPAVSVITTFRRVATSTLNSVTCSANSNCLTVTPNPVSPGVIVGDQIGCSPFDATAFTSSLPGSTTGAGVISYQWQSNTTGCNGTFANISGATSETFDAPSLTTTTYYRRMATSILNGVSCSATSNCLTVTPTGIIPGEIAGSQTLCSPFDPVAFTSVTPGSDHGTITYQWQSSTTSGSSNFVNISGATLATYDSPAVNIKTWFRRVATSDVGCADNSNVVVVTPNDIVPGVIAGNQTLCSPFDPVAFTSQTNGSTASGGVISYQWQMSTTGCEGEFTNISGATLSTYDAPAVSVITTFRRVATSTLNSVTCSANSNCLNVTPNPVSPGVIVGDQIGCSPFDAAAFTSSSPGSSTGAGVISYQWQSNTTGCNGTFANILGATSETYDAPSLTTTTYYRRVATSTLNGVTCSATSNCLTVTPTGIVPGEIAGSQTLCSPFDPVAFTSVTPGSDHGTITYQWQSSTTSGSSNFVNISGATLATYDSPTVNVKTWFRRVATSDVGCADNSNVVVVTPNDIVPGVIAGNQTLCSPFDPVAFTSQTNGSTASGGVISYQWQMSTTGCEGEFTNISGATLSTYDAPLVSVITTFRRVATSTLNSVTCSANSNCLTVTPNAVNPGVIAGDQKVCIGADIAAFTDITAGSGAGNVTYQWQSNTTGCEGSFVDIVGATSATYDPSVATVTTYYRRVATSTLNNVLCSAYSNCIIITVTSCGGPLCTYTQGYYGNVGGTSCAPNESGIFGKYTTQELITKGLLSYGGTMTVGISPNSVWMTNPDNISDILRVLPGGGSGSYALSGDYQINEIPGSYLTKKGTLNNTLLAQTITLGLNIGINGALSDFVLQSGMLVTADAEGGCGSDIPKERKCNYDIYGNLTSVTNDYHYYSIDASVIDAIEGDKTIQGLFKLANKALAGQGTNGASLTSIAGVVDIVNNAFDGCKIFLGYDIPKCSSTSIVSTGSNDPLSSKIELAGFTASPVPFKDQLTIKYDFDYQSDVRIEVYNAQGGLVLSKADTNSFLNKLVTLDLNVDKGQEQVFIVKLTTDRGSSSKKVMSAR